VAIKKMSPDGKIPKGLLMNGKPAIRNALKEFELSKMLDKENEKMPKPGSRPSDITLRRLI
jgi:serine/threonine-protein phosphatase 2B catalytic subunit